MDEDEPGKRMTIYHIPALVRDALPLAITPKNITSGFRCSGIWPLNRNIFTEDEFAPSNVTHNPIGTNLQQETVSHPQPSTSATPSTPPRPLNTEILLPAAPTKIYYTPEQVRPFPKADFSNQKNIKTRQKGKSAIITDTPERTLIKKRYNKRKVTSVKKDLVMANKSNSKQNKCVKKRNIIEKTSKESIEDETLCWICCGAYSVSKEDWLQCRQYKN